MSDTSGIINRVRFDSAVATTSADVVVKGFSNNALQGILEAISKTNSVISGLQSTLDDIQSDNDKRDQTDEKRDKDSKKDKVASLASERRSRATTAAIYGEIQRGNIFNKMLRDGLMEALSGLAGFLKENLSKSLKTQQDLAAMMRKANLTTNEKNQVHDIAINMKDIVNTKFDGLNVSNEQIKDYITDLITDGREVSRMSESELAGYIALRSRNTDSKEAYELSKTASEESIRTLTLDKGNYLIANSISKLVSSLDANARMSLGGTDEAIKKATAIAKDVEIYAGGVLDSEAVAETAMTLLKAQNLNLLGQGDFTDQQQNMIAAGGGPNVTVAEFFKNLKSSSNEVTASVNAFPSYITAFAEAAQNGRDTGKSSRSYDQIREANDTNTPDGKIPSLFEDVFNSTLGKITGPLSTWVDEMFGGSVDIASITSTGFKIVAGLLGSLILSNSGLSGKIVSGISGLGGKIISGISGLGGKIVSGISGLGGKIISGISGALKGLGSFLLKGVVHIIPKIPMIAAIGAAGASIYAAFESLTDTIDRQSNLENTEKDLKDARAQQAELESRLLIAQKANDTDAIAKYSTALAEANKRVSEAEKNYQEADNKRTAAHETSVNFEKSIRDKNKSLMDERAELRKLQQQAFAVGDIKSSEKFKKQADALNEEINANNEKIRTVSEESESFLTTGIASLTRAFGYEFSAEDMLAWSNFKDGVSEFVTEDIPNFLTSIKGAFVSAGKWIWGKISSFGRSAYGLLDEYVLTPISNAFSWLNKSIFTPIGNFFSKFNTYINDNFINPISEFFTEGIPEFFVNTLPNAINDNFINPIKGFFSKINTYINENFINPIKGFFDFKWLPEPVYKFMFDKNYSATDMVVDLAGLAVDNRKELLGETANIISEGVDFVKGLWPFANGGIVNTATPAIIGEDGKEAILPLEKPDQLLKVINDLTSSERADILNSILLSSSHQLNNLSSTLLKLANNRAQSPVVSASIINKLIVNRAVDMLESIDKDEMSIVHDHTSSSALNYTREGILSSLQTQLNSIDVNETQSIDDSLSNFINRFIDDGQLTTVAHTESNSLDKEYIEALKAVRSSYSDEAKQAATQFSKAALHLLGNKSNSHEILAAINAAVKYLRDIASSPSNKKVISSVSRPVSMPY